MQAEGGAQPGILCAEGGDGLPVGFAGAVHHTALHAEAWEFREESRAERREPDIVQVMPERVTSSKGAIEGLLRVVAFPSCAL